MSENVLNQGLRQSLEEQYPHTIEKVYTFLVPKVEHSLVAWATKNGLSEEQALEYWGEIYRNQMTGFPITARAWRDARFFGIKWNLTKEQRDELENLLDEHYTRGVTLVRTVEEPNWQKRK